ncbi:IclR family transcriptional regulator [Nocardia sp. BMG51109]|uniref:IclR family transcriptional regulator n=1 Tax=Nocardia sp. BMG51109 TaxID=1056816 RepID=UPI0004B2C67D|nr:IclR family transcriptional regulator [Nocardia sp. BMG51109]
MPQLQPSEKSAATGSDVGADMSKTLHNGLQILELLARRTEGVTVTEIADTIGVHRTVAHRLVRTLEHHHLCRRDDFKRVFLGLGLVWLAEPVEQDLRTLARPVLEELADSTQATVHLVVRENDAEVRALMVVEPRRSRMHIAFQAGQIDPIDRGSAGLAILAACPAVPGEREEVTRARRRGYAVSHGELVPSVIGVSAAVPGRASEVIASVGVSLLDAAPEDEERFGASVRAAAQRLSAILVR